MALDAELEKIKEDIKNNVADLVELVEDDRRNEKDQRKVNYNKDIVLNRKIISYKGKKNNYKYRFLLECNLNTKGNKTALIIMKNPSMADAKRSDNTVNRVVKTMCFFGYSQIYIMNLIPEYTPKPEEIHVDDLSKDILNKNDDIIGFISINVSRVFVAWGGNNNNEIPCDFYKSRIESVTIKLQKAIEKEKVYCYCYNKDKMPRHPGRARWWDPERAEVNYEKWPKGF